MPFATGRRNWYAVVPSCWGTQVRYCFGDWQANVPISQETGMEVPVANAELLVEATDTLMLIEDVLLTEELVALEGIVAVEMLAAAVELAVREELVMDENVAASEEVVVDDGAEINEVLAIGNVLVIEDLVVKTPVTDGKLEVVLAAVEVLELDSVAKFPGENVAEFVPDDVALDEVCEK